MDITLLSSDLIDPLLANLDVRDLASVSQTCTVFYNAIQRENLWKLFCIRKYGINEQYLHNRTALHVLTERGDYQAIKFMLSHKKENKEEYVNTPDINGQTAVHLTVPHLKEQKMIHQASGRALLLLLSMNGANINAKEVPTKYNVDCKENTPLIKAVLEDSGGAVEALASLGANLLATNKEGVTAIQYAEQQHKYEYSNIFKNKTPSDVLCKLVKEGNIEAVRTMLSDNTVDVNKTSDPSNKLPIHFACEKKNFPLVQLLIEKGADIKAVNIMGQTCIHYSAAMGDMKTFSLLFEHSGRDENIFNLQNTKKETVFHYACNWGHYELVKFMMSFSNPGPDLLLENPRTCLHYAVTSGNIRIVELLLKRPEVIKFIAKEEEDFCASPLTMAQESNNEDVYLCLLQKLQEYQATSSVS